MKQNQKTNQKKEGEIKPIKTIELIDDLEKKGTAELSIIHEIAREEFDDAPETITTQLIVAGLWLTIALLDVDLASILLICGLTGIITKSGLDLTQHVANRLMGTEENDDEKKYTDVRSYTTSILMDIINWQFAYDITDRMFGTKNDSSALKPYIGQRIAVSGILTATLRLAYNILTKIGNLKNRLKNKPIEENQDFEITYDCSNIFHGLSQETLDQVLEFLLQTIAGMLWTCNWELNAPGPSNLGKNSQAAYQGVFNFTVTLTLSVGTKIAFKLLTKPLLHASKKYNKTKLKPKFFSAERSKKKKIEETKGNGINKEEYEEIQSTTSDKEKKNDFKGSDKDNSSTGCYN